MTKQLLSINDEEAIGVFLQDKTAEQLLAAVTAGLQVKEYIENAGDGMRLQYTLEFIATKGNSGDLQSGYVLYTALNAISPGICPDP